MIESVHTKPTQISVCPIKEKIYIMTRFSPTHVTVGSGRFGFNILRTSSCTIYIYCLFNLSTTERIDEFKFAL